MNESSQNGTDANQSNNNGTGGGSGDGSGAGTGGNQNQNQNQSQATDQNFDVNKVLESKELWAHPRLQELTAAAKELKTLKEQQQKDADAKLKNDKKFEELATKKDSELSEAKATIKKMTIDQALTNKLVSEKVVDLDGALKLVDRSKLDVDENGNVTGVDDALSALKTEKAYLFNNQGTQNLGSASNSGNTNGGGGQMKFKQSQLKDHKFYQEHRAEILEAQRLGQIEMDVQ